MNLNFFLKKNFYKILNLNKKKKDIEEFIVIKKESKNWATVAGKRGAVRADQSGSQHYSRP